MTVTVLTGHISPETAYVVADYPYGFRLRCQIRYWIETHPRHGQRVVSQTTNPKRPGIVWNKPKASTYNDLKVLFLDEQGHVQNNGLSTWATTPQIAGFEAIYGAALISDRDQKVLKFLKMLAAKQDEIAAARKAEAQETING